MDAAGAAAITKLVDSPSQAVLKKRRSPRVCDRRKDIVAFVEAGGVADLLIFLCRSDQ